MRKWKQAVWAMGIFSFVLCAHSMDGHARNLNSVLQTETAQTESEIQTEALQSEAAESETVQQSMAETEAETEVPESEAKQPDMPETEDIGPVLPDDPDQQPEDGTGADQTVKNGLVTENGKIYFYENGSKLINKEKLVDDQWYYFQADGSAVQNDWHTFKNVKTCYYDQNGVMVHGLYKIGDRTYGFDEWSGELLSGEHCFTDGRSDQWYYFYEKDDSKGHKKGEMATGWVSHGKQQYYYNQKGEMAHGVYTVGDKTYGFNEWTGVLLSGEHYFTDGRSDQWYYFYEKDDEHGHKKGEMATGWQKHSGNDYYYNEKGEMAHGVYEINGVSYGFDEWTGAVLSGERYIDHAWRYFYEDGKMAKGWTDHHDHRYYYNDDGSMRYGEYYMDNGWYYFDEVTGIMATGWKDHHGQHYFYNWDGTMAHGEMYLFGYWYYFDDTTGVMLTGWQERGNGSKYYYDGNGRMVHGTYTVDGVAYYFDEWTGILKTGWRYENGYKVFYNADGSLCQNVDPIIGRQSSYYLKVNTATNTVTVFAKDGANGYIIPVKKMLCSTGLPGTPTVKGTFTVKRLSYWWTLMGPVYGQYVSQIYNDYLFHSSWYYVNGNKRSLSVSEYRKLGSNASHGCVRMTVGDSKWIFDNCNGSTVYIYSGADTDPLSRPVRPNPVVISGDWGYDPTDPAI